MLGRLSWATCALGLAATAAVGCGEDESGSRSNGSGGSSGVGGTAGSDASAGAGGTAGSGGSAGSDGGLPTSIRDWLLDQGHFGFVHGTYGKGSYCGAFEKGAIAGYESVRCTDTGSYIFSANSDGTLRMEETIYVYQISTPNPDGTFPWFVDGGYSGSIYWKLVPTAPALTGVDPAEAMEFDVVADGGSGNDSYWVDFGASGLKFRMILARGNADDSLLEWTTADYDDATNTWTERSTGDLFPGWFIELYPDGAFSTVVCSPADRKPGAAIGDGDGGNLATGPGYCAPKCRMATTDDPNGANGLPACAGAELAERPRAKALLPAGDGG